MSILLRKEIGRLARKEIRVELEPVRKILADQRGYIADLRRQLDALQNEVAATRKGTSNSKVSSDPNQPMPEGRSWITGKGIKALRRRLGITQAGLARLAGVSGPAVVQWEKKSGKIRLRKTTLTQIHEIRKMNKREAAARLGK